MIDKIQKLAKSTSARLRTYSPSCKKPLSRPESKIQRSKTQRFVNQRGTARFAHIFSGIDQPNPLKTGPYSGVFIRSRSQDGLSTQLLLNEKKLRKYIEKIKRECNADFEALYKKIEDKFYHFRDSPNDTVRFLHSIIDLSNKVREIKRKKIYGKKFWGIVRELDNLKKEHAKYKNNETTELILPMPADFRAIEKFIELFVYIVFKMGRLISYHYAINGKTISEEMDALNTTSKDGQDGQAPEAQNQQDSKFRKKNDLTSSSESFCNSELQDGDAKFAPSFDQAVSSLQKQRGRQTKARQRKASESQSPWEALKMNIQTTSEAKPLQIYNASRSSIQESKINLTHVDQRETKLQRLGNHLITFLEKECPVPTFVCRLCEERVPVLNQEFHTQYCQKRRHILDKEDKKIRNEVFNAYAKLNELVNNKRMKFHLKRSESMMENKTYDFDTRKAALKSTQNSVTLSRSQSKLLPTTNKLSQNNITNQEETKQAKGQILKKQRTALLEKSLHLGQSQKKRSTTTGEMKRTMMKNIVEQKSRVIHHTSNASSSSSKISPNTTQRKEEIKRLAFARGYSYQSEKKGRTLGQRRNQHIHISTKSVNPVVSDIDKYGTQSLTPLNNATPFFNESFSEQKRRIQEEQKSNQDFEEREQASISFQNQVQFLQGTPSSTVDKDWENISKGSYNSGLKARLAKQKQGLFKRCASHQHSIGYFTQELHEHFMANQYARKGSNQEKSAQLKKQGFKKRSIVHLNEKEETNLDQEVPSQTEFLTALSQAVLTKKSSSNYAPNFLMKSAHSSHEGSDNNSVQNILDHLGARPFGESIDQGSLPHSRRNSTKSKFSAKQEPKSTIIEEATSRLENIQGNEDPRDEIFDTATEDQVEESMYSPVQIKRLGNEEAKKQEVEEKKQSFIRDKRRQSLFAAIPQSKFPDIILTLDCPSEEKKAHSESFNQTSTEKSSEIKRKEASIRKKRFKSEDMKKQSSSSMNGPVPRLDLLSLQNSRTKFLEVKDRPSSISPRIERGITRKDKKKASQIDPRKDFSQEKSWREVSKVALRKSEVMQSFNSIKRMKKMNRVEIKRSLEEKYSKDSMSSSKKEDTERTKTLQIKKIKKGKGKEVTPTHSFGREKSYKTMGSWKTAASDNSFWHKNLNSLGSYISHRSTNSLQALAQITETAKQQYLQPLTKQSLSYDLEGTLEKIDIHLKKYEFTEKELEAILNFKKSLRAKYSLALDLAHLEAKISSTLDQSFYWQKDSIEQSFTKEFNQMEREASYMRAPLSERETLRNPLRRSESGNDLRKPTLTSTSYHSHHSFLGRSFAFSQRKKQNGNSQSSKHNSGSRSPASDIPAPDPSQQPQIKQILESMNIKSRSNSASSTNTTKSWSRLQQIDEKKEASQTSPLRTRAPKKKSKFNCIKQFEPEVEKQDYDEYNDKADEMLQNQSFELEFYEHPKKELTIVPQEAKAMNSTYNQFDGGDFYKIESLQEGQYSKLLSEFQLKRMNSNTSLSDRSNSNESHSVSFSDSNQGHLIHLKTNINKSAMSPRRARDKKSDYGGKKRSNTRSPINPIQEEANEGKFEDFLQIKKYSLFDRLKQDDGRSDGETRSRRLSSAKEIDKYQIEGESFNVVVHKDKGTPKDKAQKVKLSFMGQKLQRASDISLDESYSGLSEGMLSVSAIQPNEANSDCQNLVSQNSGTVKNLVQQSPKQHQVSYHKDSSEFEEEGSVEEEQEVKGTFSSYLLPKRSKLLKSYPIKRTSTTIPGKELFEGNPLINTNEQFRRNTVAQPVYKTFGYNSSRRIKQKFADLRIQKTLFAINEAVTDNQEQPTSGKLPHLERYSLSDSKEEDVHSMPDMPIRKSESGILSSFEQLSDGVQSDHILDFGHFVLQSMDYFAESDQDDSTKRRYSNTTRMIEVNDFSETDGVAESNSGEEHVIEEVTNQSQQESKSEKKYRMKGGAKDFYSSKILSAQRVQRLPLQRRSTMSFDMIDLQEEQSSIQRNSSNQQSSYESPMMIKSQSMEFTPSMLESVRNMELSSTAKIQISNFHIIKRLSKGAYGYVVLAEKKTSKDLFAIKIMNVKEVVKKNQMDLLTVEKDILNSVHSEFVVHGAYTFKDDNFLYIAMEYLPGGDLAALLQNECRFEWDEAKFYLKEIVQALQYFRSMEYVHRDLKPDNILLDKEGHLKLTDFGLSKAGLMEKKDRLNKSTSDESNPSIISINVSSSSLIGSRKRANNSQSLRVTATHNNQEKRILGTPNYMSPEVIEGKDHSYPVDYWSLGVIAYEIIVGALPFSGDTVQELFKNILEGNVEYPDVDDEVWPQATDDFVKKLLDPNPKTRLGSKSIEEIKQHPYFAGVNWNQRDLKPPYVPEIKNRQDFVNQDQNRVFSDQSFMRIIRATANVATPKRKSIAKSKRGVSILGGGLETVQEEQKDSKQGRRMDNWESHNTKYLKQLNKTEAMKKIASYWKDTNQPRNPKRIPESLMEELKPNDPVFKRLQQKQKSEKKSPPESTFKREAWKTRKQK